MYALVLLLCGVLCSFHGLSAIHDNFNFEVLHSAIIYNTICEYLD